MGENTFKAMSLPPLSEAATHLLENWRAAAPYEFTGGERQIRWCADTLESLLKIYAEAQQKLPDAG